MEKWIHGSLSQLLDFPVPEELTMYIIQIQNERDLDDYLKTLLNYDNSKHRNFVSELKKRKAGNIQGGYKKVDDNQAGIQKQIEKKKGKMKEKEESHEKAGKKKTKFVNMYSEDGKDMMTVLLKNRVKCDCEARIHPLINNCLSCGRIVCAQEGSGPCFFCEELVCTPDQQSILSMNTKQSDSLYNKLMDQKLNAEQMAISQRDKLLEFDRHSTKRTQVIDDESDYYQSADSVWLSEKERQAIQKHEEDIRNKKYGSRLSKKVTIDIYGREVVDEQENLENILFAACEETPINMESNVDLTCPTIEFERPEYVPTNIHLPTALELLDDKRTPMSDFRVQDKQLLEMHDEGRCLSMHQPYASLLVAGIKKHEGRTWYSAHRGRMWIHAALKVVSAEDIATVENQYHLLYNDEVKFPKSYPTGCLLGCVTVVDVLSQEEYRNIYPDGESESPYVFICEDFRELRIKLPMQGKHKIYKLDKSVHQAAIKWLP